MKFLTPIGNLSQIGGGTLLAGVVPMARIVRSYNLYTNAGLVTVLGVSTLIVDHGGVEIPMVLGDYVLAFVQVNGNKLLALGSTRLTLQLTTQIAQPVNWGNAGVDLQQQDPATPATTNLVFGPFGLGVVSATGDYGVDLSGVSAGSNFTIAAGLADVSVLVLHGES